jgi:hypothetical protein
MRIRSLYALTVVLLLVLAACSHKSADNSTAQNPPASNATGVNATNSPPADQQPATPAPAPATSASAPATSAPAATATPAPPPPPPPPVVVPAGTTFTVRLAEAIGSKLSSPGDTFKATLADDITVNGNTVIPAGATARGTVVDAKPLGKLKGGALLQVRLTSIVVNGVSQSIDTTSVERQEKGKGKRTAALAGGGAALGGIIGGLAGGGKGAAIGLLAGGGAGGAGAAYTGNKEIVLPAESALSFKLKGSFQVKAAQ